MKHPIPHDSDPQRTYTYYAFISYRHVNQYWGKWIQRNLELFRLPSRLCREKRVPRHVTPVFRDETDLSGGKTVQDLLTEKIRQSKYLIVICSRDVHKAPKYIDFEIEAFLASGNPASRILPVIVDGEANAKDPAMECLPTALLNMGDQMPLGIKVNKKDKKEAILKLVAAILELDLQSLRAHNHERKQRRIMAALGSGLAFALGLGAFMGWQLLSVKQAGLHEQLIYAEDTFRQGDKLTTFSTAETVAAEYLPMMDPDIKTDAAQLQLMSAIHPKYQPLVRLTDVAANSRLLFDNDGRHLMVISETSVEKFDTAGQRVMAFDISQKAHQIMDVCSDGIHAVVLTIPGNGDTETRAWLWNMETDQALQMLVSSAEYDQENEKAGFLGGVVKAKFSPDGKTVCAWRDGEGGYYNASSELTAWDVATGSKLFSFPAELLGKGNQEYEIMSFEFIGNDTFHWVGKDHIYYTLGDPEPLVLPIKSLPSVRDKAKNIISLGHYRYTLLSQNGTAELKDLITGSIFTCPMQGTANCHLELNDRYLLLWSEQKDDKIASLTIADLKTMQEATCSESLREKIIGLAVNSFVMPEGSHFLYIVCTDGSIYRFDLENSSWMELVFFYDTQYLTIASLNGKDIFAGTFEGRTCIMEVDDHQMQEYILDEDYDLFSASAVFSPAGYMAANHNGSYYLYPAVHPGVQLDQGDAPDANALYAASENGQTILKASGQTVTLWHNAAQKIRLSMNEPVQQMHVSDAGAFVVLTQKELRLYSNQGEMLGQYLAEESAVLQSAKISRDGQRVLLMENDGKRYEYNASLLHLMDGSTLEPISQLSQYVHAMGAGVFETSFDISPDGRWIAAVVRTTYMLDSAYQPYVCVWSAEDGSLIAQTQCDANEPGITVLSLEGGNGTEKSQNWLQYARFASNGKLLCGLQYGTWIFNMDAMTTEQFIYEGAMCDAMPDMLDNGLLIYPANGIHAWNTQTGSLAAIKVQHTPDSRTYAMLRSKNQNRMYLSPDQQWLAFAGSDDTWLYHTADWSASMVLVPQRAQILYLDDTQMIYATADGLWQSVHQ